MTVESQLESLIEVASELIELMEAETALLRGMDVKGIGPMQEDKMRLTGLYEERARRLAAVPRAIQELPSETKERFGELMVRFKRTAGENELALLAARQAHDTLFEAVIHAAEKQRREGAGYGGDGASASGGKSAKGGKPLSLSLNREL